MNAGDDDRDFERRTRERLLDSAEALDARTRSRLTQARHAALDEMRRGAGQSFRVPGFWLPAGAFACAAMLGLAVWMRTPSPQGAATVASAVTAPAAVEDLALLASTDADMYAEDAEFYEWAGSDDAQDATRG